MFENSVLARTGQLWKVSLAVIALVAGSIVPAFPAAGMSWTAGTVLAIAGYAAGVLFTRCPSCGERWFWTALIRSELYKPLFTQSDCPSCHHSFAKN
jgi:hypothetical protein